MERAALLEALVGLASEAGVTVRRLGRGSADPSAPARSGACRIRGAPWLLLSADDPLEERIAAAAAALAGLGAGWREGRFLPPAVRRAIEAAAAGDPAAGGEGPDREGSPP
jgi:hypothetical protein